MGRSKQRWATVGSATLLLSLALAATPAHTAVTRIAHAAVPPASTDASSQGLKVVGELPEPKAHSPRLYVGAILSVDGPGRRMYYAYTDTSNVAHVVGYDLHPRVPTPIYDAKLGSADLYEFSPYSTALDTKRQQLAFLSFNPEVAGNTIPAAAPQYVVFFGTGGKHEVRRMDLTTVLPGYNPIGITYSPSDDRYYLIGEMTEDNLLINSVGTFGSKVIGPGTTVVALNAKDGSLAWVRPLTDCQQALYTLGVGGIIVRSDLRPAIYVACVTGATPAGNVYPGQAGLVRLTIDPKASNTAQALQFPTEFFPISGKYFNGAAQGIAVFDHRTDRFFLQSLAPATPGAWVFDGRLSAWAGFVSAPSSADQYAGFNEHLGHLYIGTNADNSRRSPTDGILVADGRETPLPAGDFTPLITSAYIATDTLTNRMFVLPLGASTSLKPYLVIEDNSPAAIPLAELDYDALTNDVSEAQASYVSYAGDATGYGNQVTLVGGTTGATSILGSPEVPNVAGGSRGIVGARVPSLDLRPAGAAAGAQALVADVNTTSGYENSGVAGKWPYSPVTCLDSGGGVKPQHAASNGNTADATCDLAKKAVAASADSSALTIAGIHLGHAGFDGKASRSVATGLGVTGWAQSDGASIDIPGGYALQLGRVRADSSTAARGRPGTTTSQWVRSVQGIHVTGPGGAVLYASEGCASKAAGAHGVITMFDTCQPIADAINKLLPTRLKVQFPLPQLLASKRGAYAAVQQSDADYHQERTVDDQGVIYRSDSVSQRPVPSARVIVYNDNVERSRVVTQLAAVQTSAIYYLAKPDLSVLPPPAIPSTAPVVDKPLPAPRSVKPTSAPVEPPAIVAEPPTSTGGIVKALTGLLLLHRSAKDSVLLACFLLLGVGAAALALRRRSLVQLIALTDQETSS